MKQIWYKLTYLRNRNRIADIENRLVVVKGKTGMEWEAGHSRCKLSVMERIDNEVLLYSTGNYIQYPEINHNGKEAFKKESIYMCNGITLLHSRNQQNLADQRYCNFKNWLKNGLKLIKRLSLLKIFSQWRLQTVFAGLLTSFPVLHTILSLHIPPYLETRATSLKCKLINIPNLFQTIRHSYYSETETYCFPMVYRALYGVSPSPLWHLHPLTQTLQLHSSRLPVVPQTCWACSCFWGLPMTPVAHWCHSQAFFRVSDQQQDKMEPFLCHSF